MTDSEVAIVTGGVQGLGASFTNVLLQRGYKVVVADIQEEKGEKLVKEQEKTCGPGKLLFCRCDVRNIGDFQNVFEFTLKHFKRIDLLMNNAGVVTEKDPKLILDVNVMGVYNGIQAALKYMGKDNGGDGGTVINTASTAAFKNNPGFPMYSASKHAVISFTKCYGHEYYLDKTGITFSALCPSLVRTSILSDLNEHAVFRNIDYYDFPKLLDADDVAKGVSRLLDDKINGSALVCNKDKGFFYVDHQMEFEDLKLQDKKICK